MNSLLISTAVIFSSVVSDTVSIPSLNYWELSGKILSDARYADMLEVSPAQKAELRKLRRSSPFSKEFARAARSLEEKQPLLIRASTVRRSLAWNELDDRVATWLKKVLLPEQIAEMKSLALTRKFNSGLQPFLELEIALALDLDMEVFRSIHGKANELSWQYWKDTSNNALNHAKLVAQRLPAKSRARFRAYFGAEVLPLNGADPPFNLDDIPFPGYCTSSAATSALLVNPDLAGRLRLTAQQSYELENLMDAESDELAAYGVTPNNIEGFMKHLRKVGMEGTKRIKQILSEEQRLLLAQTIALDRFTWDFKAPFENSQLISFLKLDEDDIPKMIEISSEAQQKLTDTTRSLDKKYYLLMAKELPPEARRKLTATLGHLWDIE